MKRLDQPEEMDQPDVDAAELFAGLEQLAGINSWLGGWWSVRRALAVALPREAWEQAVILDVATGGGDIARSIAHSCRRQGVRIVALDLHPVTLEYARRRTGSECAVQFLRADGRALPLRSASVDVALCSLALHHFSEADAVRILGEMRRVARRAVVVTDLRRSGVAWLLIRLLTRLVWRSRIVRHDGPVSVRRAFTPGELAALAERAGLCGARVLRQPLYRMALVYRTEGVGEWARPRTGW
jgi:SAM-dependent methyltransferase